MKRLIYICMALVIAATAVHAEDIDVFSDCDNATPPNVLVLFDTSTSMRKQDVYGASILDYDNDITDWNQRVEYQDPNHPSYNNPYGTPNKLYYKPSSGGLWLSFKSLSIAAVSWTHPVDVLADIQCEDVRNTIEEDGFFNGKVKARHGDCGGNSTPERIVATANYLNYMEYVEVQMKELSYGDGALDGPPGFDRKTYCPTTDYYNYHGNGMGYGDYSVGYGQYNRGEDRVYIKMGMIRPYSSVLHPGGIKVKDLGCEKMKNELLINGWSMGKVYETNSCNCVNLLSFMAVPKLLMTQNFLNYLDMKNSRRYNGIDALYDVIQARHTDANFGIMQFDLGQTNVLNAWKSNGGDLAAPCGASLTELKRVLYSHVSNPDKQYGQPLNFGNSKNDIGKDTPLAESLVEAGLYFAGQPSWFNDYDFDSTFFETSNPIHQGDTANHKYKSPIECPEQGNHVIILTDGAPSDDFGLADLWVPHNAIYNWNFRTYEGTTLTTAEASRIGDFDKDKEACFMLFGSCFDSAFKQTYVDDVAAFLNKKDLSPLPGPQFVNTHTISFRMDADAPAANSWLLSNTAENGDGSYFVVGGKSGENPNQTNTESMREALSKALMTIVEGAVKVSTFSSAVTPVRQDDLTYSGDETLLTTFHVSSSERGKGNVKKYKRCGDVIMGIGDAPLLENGGVVKGVKDLWSEHGMGGTDEDIPHEGVAGVLKKRLEGITIQDNSDWHAKLNQVAKVRKIYGVRVDGGSGNNPHYKTKDLRTMATGNNPEISLPKADGSRYRDHLLQQFLAEDVYGLDLDWPLGHVVHSDVVVAQYPEKALMFVGANDGMLHCFDMVSGQEEWALVPPDQLDRLYLLENTLIHPWYIDGNMVLTHKFVNNKRLPDTLIFGERRGGSAYHLLDVEDITKSNKNAPTYVAMVGGGGKWGQSWSTPRLCQVVTSPLNKGIGFLVGGGYDPNQDEDEPEADSLGKFVGIFDFTGNEIEIIEEYYVDGVATPIEACIVGARIIDHDHDAERIFSRIYAGDLIGNIYHFSDELLKDSTTGKWRVKPFDRPEGCGAGDTGDACKVMDGSWPQRHKLFEPLNADGTRVKQKIFYAPMYGKACDIDMVYAGTGDREKPEGKSVTNSVYAIRERWEKDSGDVNDHDTLVRSDLVRFNIQEDITAPTIKGFTSYTETTTVTHLSSAKGWYFDFFRAGEKVISEISVVGGNLIFGTYTPKEEGTFSDRCGASDSCKTGEGRVYVVNACPWNFEVKSIVTGGRDPMPQPAIIFDKDSGKVLISTGDGGVYDPDLPVVEPEYWKSSTSGN